MLPVNFFETRLHINICLHRGSHAEVSYKGKTLFSGPREACFSNIRNLVNELDSLGKKEIWFHIQNMTIGDSSFHYDVRYFKEHLGVLKSTAKSQIEIKSGLYTLA